jgi:selenocysteine-specific elongation factor
VVGANVPEGETGGGTPVLATAGHVDHGKSTLVPALTGMEPDRWAEERRRGLTIDLGYAWTALPSGQQVAFVDVPGHQRFTPNMLAGLVEPSAVVFVVAADEGWRPQSTEHLAAIDALGISAGVLVVTRADLADPDPALREATARLARTSLRPVAALAVSAATGAGLAALRAALDDLVAVLPARPPGERTRLWVDRAFTIRGVGTIVTGTLGSGGRIRVGDGLTLRGDDGTEHAVTVRGLESLGRPWTQVRGPARVAVNLRGVARDLVARGTTLLTPHRWPATTVLDARLSLPSPDAGHAGRRALPAQLMLHAGTAALPVRVRPLASHDPDPEDAAGQPGPLVRITLPRPVPLVAGDQAILRDPGQHHVAAGLVVLDADPPDLQRRGAAARRAAQLATATGRPDAELARRGFVQLSHLALLGADATALTDAVLVDDLAIAAERWAVWRTALVSAVRDHARAHPLEPGMPVRAAARAAGIPFPAATMAAARAAGLLSRDGRLSAPGSEPELDASIPGLRALAARPVADPFAAPERPDLQAMGLGRRELAAAARAGRILLLAGDLALAPDAVDRARASLAALPQPFTTSQARAALGTTRRVAIPLLEHLDATDVTRRLDPNRRALR